MSSTHHQQIKLVSEDKLKEEKMTADNLMGKKILDRDGETVGTVKDIGLGTTMHGAKGSYSSTQSYSGSSSATSGADSSRTRPSDVPSRTGTTTAGTMSDVSAYQNAQPILYVKLDGKLDIKGDHLAAIPASQVRFESDKKALTMQLARSELASQLKAGGSSYNR